MHPGFKSLDQAFKLIDMTLSMKVGRLRQNRLAPRIIQSSTGGEIAWIFPIDICKKFGGKRIRVNTRVRYEENSACLLWIWKGRGKINNRRARAGEELFIIAAAARDLYIENDGEEVLELFAFFPL
jgi:hypothetical protein